MGGSLHANLGELGCSADEAEAVAEALLQPEHEAEHEAEPRSGGGGPPAAAAAAAVAVAAEAGPGGSSAGGATSAGHEPPASFRQRVAELQAELFADDLEPPPGAHAWGDAQLRAFFESGGACAPQSDERAPGALPTMPAHDDGVEENVEEDVEAEAAAEAEVRGPIVGTLRLKWQARNLLLISPGPARSRLISRRKRQAHSADFSFAADTTVGALKRWLHRRTGVRPARQKLLGLAAGGRRGGAAAAGGEAADSALLTEVQPPAGKASCLPFALCTPVPVPPLPLVSATYLSLHATPPKVVTMLGTPEAEVAAAEQQLQHARRTTARAVHNDLAAPAASPEHAAAAAAGARAAARPACARPSPHGGGGRPVDPGRGSGVWLDPSVWAEDAPPSEYRTNPYTRRRERLGLGNALLGHGGVRAGGAAAADRPAPRPEEEAPTEQPLNVDLLGQARGGCTACARCPGFERRELRARPLLGPGAAEAGADAPRWAENDVEVLRCQRCGCFSHQHESV